MSNKACSRCGNELSDGTSRVDTPWGSIRVAVKRCSKGHIDATVVTPTGWDLEAGPQPEVISGYEPIPKSDASASFAW